ncbi:hypothetical protein DBR11_05480 [Pedobacter sp. HMWF019]|uniref:GIN domain-containing protein n=1 Tax=Pedobacter sp. HMWF019 TaxID=2056856 RepID=UPI000D33BDEA|nr:DUF2807 domain-containing protein [Pedobacter sp. HMWF019]PTT02157.1 hypothetical protein DBR11_05480 [Pedobacter sp. HMWF019]
MKTAIKTLFATALTAVILTSSAFNTSAQEANTKTTIASVVSGTSMIRVIGNVTIYLRQGDQEKIRVETGQSEAKVYLKRNGSKLFIRSESSQPSFVYLTVKNLMRIDASENAIVKTSGCFTVPVLQVFAENQAKIDVKVVAQDLYTVIKDDSYLKLSGSADRHVSEKRDASNLNVTRFAALKTTSPSNLLTAADLDAQLAEAVNMALILPKNSK